MRTEELIDGIQALFEQHDRMARDPHKTRSEAELRTSEFIRSYNELQRALIIPFVQKAGKAIQAKGHSYRIDEIPGGTPWSHAKASFAADAGMQMTITLKHPIPSTLAFVCEGRNERVWCKVSVGYNDPSPPTSLLLPELNEEFVAGKIASILRPLLGLAAAA
ncbi:hypothetical protein BH10PSE7_BH10PSE7_05040 [soil metagenome]